jgi:hypothetical protein
MRPAEILLSKLGISDPRDIELEAIAHCVDAEVNYRRIVGSEAQIIGFKDRAIIYVRSDTPPHRKRFSTAHELGHWYHHRGQSFVCRPDDIGLPPDEKSKNAERMADAYAGDLVLPSFMFGPILQQHGIPSLESIVDIAKIFTTSATATAIRAMRLTREPVIVVAHDLFGRKWQWPSIVVGNLRIRDDVDARATAFTSMLSAGRFSPLRKEPASYWFDRRHVEQFDVRVQSLRTVDGEALTLVRILDTRMIEIYG